MEQKLAEANVNGHPKAILEVSGIPLSCDFERFEKALKLHGGPEFETKIKTKLVPTSHPERRVFVKLNGLSPTLIPWITVTTEQALSDCGHAHFEMSAVLLQR